MNRIEARRLRPGDLVVVGQDGLGHEKRNSRHWVGNHQQGRVMTVTGKGGLLLELSDGRQRWFAYSHVQPSPAVWHGNEHLARGRYEAPERITGDDQDFEP